MIFETETNLTCRGKHHASIIKHQIGQQNEYKTLWHNRNIYATILQMIEIREYLGRDGRNLFGDWFDRLSSEAARRVLDAAVALKAAGRPEDLAGRTFTGSYVSDCTSH